MKRLFGLSILGILFAVIVSTQLAPAKTGAAVYAWATDFEAGVYGLDAHIADIGEMNLHYYKNDIQADRPTILMLHGYSADKDVWTRFAKHFTKEFNVVVPDMAGHGDTGFDEKWSYSMVDQAGRMIKLLEHLDIESAHVVGNSMGGFIAAQMARLYPQKVLTANLIDPAGVISPIKSDMEKMVSEGRNPFEIDNREQFDEFYAMTMAQPPYFPDFILEAVSEQYKKRKPELIAIFEDFHGKDMLDEQLHEITVPVLLMWGDQDRLLHVSAVDVWAQGVKNIETKIWQGIGHMPMMEVSQESADYYREFLGRHDKTLLMAAN